MGIKTVPPLPIVQTLLPVTFGYSLSSEAVEISMKVWFLSYNKENTVEVASLPKISKI